MLLCNLPTLFFDPGQQALDLSVGWAQAAGLNQVFQGCVELTEWRERESDSKDRNKISEDDIKREC